MRYCAFTVFVNLTLDYAVAAPCNRCVNCSVTLDITADNRIIVLFDFACELCRRQFVFCNQNYAACVSVEAIDGTKSGACTGVIRYKICKCVATVISAFVNGDERRLVQNNYIIVLIDDFYIELCRRCRRAAFFDFDFDCVAGVCRVNRFCKLAVFVIPLSVCLSFVKGRTKRRNHAKYRGFVFRCLLATL